MKRLSAPKFWPINRKTKKFAVTPLPGAHCSSESIPLALVLRDILGYAENMKEVKEILSSGVVRIDNKVRKRHRLSVGLMDIITLNDENYRVMPGNKGLYLCKIEKDAGIKLRKIKNKTVLRKGRIQLNFHDGTNIVADKDYSTGDVAVFDLKTGKIKDVIKYENGAQVIVIKGTSAGTVGKLENKNITKGSGRNTAEISAGDRKLLLPVDYVFPIGKEKPVITLGESESKEGETDEQ